MRFKRALSHFASRRFFISRSSVIKMVETLTTHGFHLNKFLTTHGSYFFLVFFFFFFVAVFFLFYRTPHHPTHTLSLSSARAKRSVSKLRKPGADQNTKKRRETRWEEAAKGEEEAAAEEGIGGGRVRDPTTLTSAKRLAVRKLHQEHQKKRARGQLAWPAYLRGSSQCASAAGAFEKNDRVVAVLRHNEPLGTEWEHRTRAEPVFGRYSASIERRIHVLVLCGEGTLSSSLRAPWMLWRWGSAGRSETTLPELPVPMASFVRARYRRKKSKQWVRQMLIFWFIGYSWVS